MCRIYTPVIVLKTNILLFRFAQSLEVVPRVLAENSGVKAKEVISSLYAAHAEGKKNVGFDIEGEAGDCKVCSFSTFFLLGR